MLTRDEFNQEIVEETKKKICTEMNISLHKVSKNNGVVLDAVTIMLPGMYAAPTLYLDAYYDEYSSGVSIGNLTEKLLAENGSYMFPEISDPEDLMDYEAMTGNLRYRLINYDMNRELLKTIPYIRYLDLAKIYYFIVNMEGSFAARIVRLEDLRLWGVDEKELDTMAEANMSEQEPPSVELISDLLRKMGGEMAEEPEDVEGMGVSWPMYVISNKRRFYGAACLLYPGLMEALAARMDAGFFILPSSVHELIAVPDNGIFARRDLENLVTEINLSHVERVDILSNHVYYYSRMSGTVTM